MWSLLLLNMNWVEILGKTYIDPLHALDILEAQVLAVYGEVFQCDRLTVILLRGMMKYCNWITSLFT